DSKRARSSQIAETLVVAQQQVEQIRAELVGIEREINGVESTQHSLRGEAESSQSEFSRCEVKLAENRARVQFLSEDVTREFQVEIAGLDWKRLLWKSDGEPEGLKPLDLDEDDADEKPEGAAPSAEAKAAAPEPKLVAAAEGTSASTEPGA